MTEQTTSKVRLYAGSAADAPAPVADAMAKMMASQIGVVQVRILGLEPGKSEVEYDVNPSGPFAAGGIPPGYPGFQKDAYIAAYRLFLSCIIRELNADFADNFRGW
ncbi:MAG: hypothetical protein ACRDFX_01625 [Chloroflexota bacterium]